MAKYELPDHVVKNIQVLVLEANIKGNQAPAILEILKCFETPVVEGSSFRAPVEAKK